MGRFVAGLLLGLLAGLLVGENLFPDGFNRTAERWAEGVRSQVPGH